MKKATIIGAGLGGLTVGALLAKSGYRVTLLEQHTIVGGCATTFKRGDFTCEVGLHEMNGVYSDPIIIDIFKKLGVYDHIEFVKPNEFFSVITKNGKFIMPDGIDNAKQALKEKFPHEKQGIEKYFTTIGKVAKSLESLQNASWHHYLFFPFYFWNILFYKNKNVTKVLDKIIQDEELKHILNSNVQYYNDTPNTLGFLLHAVAQYSYYSGSGWFIKGGSGRLSDYLAKVIRENGGEIITKATVTACNETLVTYLHKKESKTIQSDIIISNISPEQTYVLYEIPYKEHKELGNSLLTIYLGFNKNLKEVYGKGEYSNFILNDNEFTFIDYAQIDSGLTDKDKSFGAICMIDDLKKWNKLDKKSYKEKKNRLMNTMIEELEKYYPNISKLIEYAEVGTAKTVKRYIHTPNGTAYGFKPTPKQFFRIPQIKSKKVNNLYFVGQWVIAGGFNPAIVSAELCFRTITKR